MDTDVLAIASLHDVGDCAIALSHHLEKHRLCVSVPLFRSELLSAYKLEPSAFVAIAVAKGCDFAEPVLTGLPDWHDTLRLCSPHAGRVVVDGQLHVSNFTSMLRTVAANHKRAKMDVNRRENAAFAFDYWITLGSKKRVAEDVPRSQAPLANEEPAQQTVAVVPVDTEAGDVVE